MPVSTNRSFSLMIAPVNKPRNLKRQVSRVYVDSKMQKLKTMRIVIKSICFLANVLLSIYVLSELTHWIAIEYLNPDQSISTFSPQIQLVIVLCIILISFSGLIGLGAGSSKFLLLHAAVVLIHLICLLFLLFNTSLIPVSLRAEIKRCIMSPFTFHFLWSGIFYLCAVGSLLGMSSHSKKRDFPENIFFP